MKLNNKFFSALMGVLAIQIVFGINLVRAMQCEKEIEQTWSEWGNPAKSRFNLLEWSGSDLSLEETKEAYYEHIKLMTERNPQYGNKYGWDINNLYKSCKDYAQSHLDNRVDTAENMTREKKYGQLCVIKYMVENDCKNLEVFKYKKGSSQQSSSSNSSNQSSSRANQQSANNQSSSTSSVSPNPNNQQPSASSNDSVNGLNMKPEQAAIVNEAGQTYATKTAAFEESHKGLKRTHNKEDEASRCLIMEGRNIKNTCDFRVEYTFCAYKPNLKAFSAAFEMAAAFDCEQRKFGSAGISAKRKAAGSFTAEAVYVFGCKDPSLSRGVTYERGRGLSGRCSE